MEMWWWVSCGVGEGRCCITGWILCQRRSLGRIVGSNGRPHLLPPHYHSSSVHDSGLFWQRNVFLGGCFFNVVHEVTSCSLCSVSELPVLTLFLVLRLHWLMFVLLLFDCTHIWLQKTSIYEIKYLPRTQWWLHILIAHQYRTFAYVNTRRLNLFHYIEFDVCGCFRSRYVKTTMTKLPVICKTATYVISIFNGFVFVTSLFHFFLVWIILQQSLEASWAQFLQH